jgi:hypothetical protein
VLRDGNWSFWKEKAFLADLAYDAMVDCELWIQAWPVSRSDWNEADPCKGPFFVESARADAKPVSEAI